MSVGLDEVKRCGSYHSWVFDTLVSTYNRGPCAHSAGKKGTAVYPERTVFFVLHFFAKMNDISKICGFSSKTGMFHPVHLFFPDFVKHLP